MSVCILIGDAQTLVIRRLFFEEFLDRHFHHRATLARALLTEIMASLNRCDLLLLDFVIAIVNILL